MPGYDLPFLLSHSGLPGPRGNLELLYSFARASDAVTIDACLSLLKDDTSNSPEEFAGMCGVLGRALALKTNREALAFLRPYARHGSWRIREAVAMGIQERATQGLQEILALLEGWMSGGEYERRAVVAGLAEPKLLTNAAANCAILRMFAQVSDGLSGGRLTEAGKNGYGVGAGYVLAPGEDGMRRDSGTDK